MAAGEHETRISLDQQDFRDLVNGHEVRKWGWDQVSGDQVQVRIILSDIGFKLMLSEISHAMRGK